MRKKWGNVVCSSSIWEQSPVVTTNTTPHEVVIHQILASSKILKIDVFHHLNTRQNYVVDSDSVQYLCWRWRSVKTVSICYWFAKLIKYVYTLVINIIFWMGKFSPSPHVKLKTRQAGLIATCNARPAESLPVLVRPGRPLTPCKPHDSGIVCRSALNRLRRQAAGTVRAGWASFKQLSAASVQLCIFYGLDNDVTIT